MLHPAPKISEPSKLRSSQIALPWDADNMFSESTKIIILHLGWMEVIHSGNISAFTQLGEDALAALALKAPSDSPIFSGTVSGISKAMVQLGNVDNTSDLAKPISTATQTALNSKYSQADANVLRNYTSALGTSLDENCYVKVQVD